MTVTGSKSETNRLLLLQALFPELEIDNISNSDDAQVMQQGLASDGALVDIHHAGTAMRFLTAYFASRAGREVVLTGSERMRQRPLEILVDALKDLGAEITYEGKKGCPPLRIKGQHLKGPRVTMPASVSSQYISALILIGPSLPEGLELTLEGNITSMPYIHMTLGLLKRLGIQNSFTGNQISIAPAQSISGERQITVESDWSSASYYYSIVALSEPGTRITLRFYREDSLQGDSALVDLFKPLGVHTSFEADRITLSKGDEPLPPKIKHNLIQTPDLAQTLVACCFGLGIGCDLTGLHTLKIKETDRLQALYNEITKLGGSIRVTDRSLYLKPEHQMLSDKRIATYNDHRMAMAFAPLAMVAPLSFEDAGVVSKSYPDFWKDLEVLGFTSEEVSE
ncbi:3-phosphoshikimate 1-carboxyvinyltransferase [Robiginitalea myxolifaciens]|uniref:3-phosphoshikimate 1-carboxyvinyltransferase n=1 Tax=Robiginitalea myxolifaciens TaxID=400055 RepID=A0A1I6FRG2_9FLAO|nr:3-phosphoshikimate 1-carboxyvinyltransferase [Robiginitalea myxolifaciens]